MIRERKLFHHKVGQTWTRVQTSHGISLSSANKALSNLTELKAGPNLSKGLD